MYPGLQKVMRALQLRRGVAEDSEVCGGRAGVSP